MAESPLRTTRNMTNGEFRATDIRSLNKDELYECVQELLAAEDAYITEIAGLIEENETLEIDAGNDAVLIDAARASTAEIVKIIFGLDTPVSWPALVEELKRLKAQDRG
jgi:hypothetical protein